MLTLKEKQKLTEFKRAYSAACAINDNMTTWKRLAFYRWLVEKGRINDK
jgi:hypothetical protein